MTINEIKDLAKKLKEEDVEKIKEEIKNKESILKVNTLDEEELMEVLNTLFSILVIEKALEDEVEGIEEIREELQNELMEAYQQYDDYMARYKKEDKKKKKKWLLNMLLLSDDIHSKKEGINKSDKIIKNLKNQINDLKQQRSDENLHKACKEGREGRHFKKFCETPQKCDKPRYDHNRKKTAQHLNKGRQGGKEEKLVNIYTIEKDHPDLVNVMGTKR